jgi:hypothetical protein
VRPGPANCFLRKFRPPSFSERKFIRVHLWFHLGVGYRRASACIGGSFHPRESTLSAFSSCSPKFRHPLASREQQEPTRPAKSGSTSNFAKEVSRNAPQAPANCFLGEFPATRLSGRKPYPCPSVSICGSILPLVIGVHPRASAVSSSVFIRVHPGPSCRQSSACIGVHRRFLLSVPTPPRVQ